ncbi:hypothetical protein KSS94_04205 [Pseudomonas fakonensis]|uniref:Uncharacterized protein n=1 Tax=Pseudomonas fakonensis TaxID=2842355 RepID=A0ABX8N8N9_9PSED|nr:hypothetical protein [Pseudomonas fakonensis]QXH52337.1 hypothetical protein KSS94_04205 [Pseudomonas fakonensis]
MLIANLYRILASALRRPSSAARKPHRIYLIDSHALATRANQEARHD